MSNIVFVDGCSQYDNVNDIDYNYNYVHPLITYQTEYARESNKGYIKIPGGGGSTCYFNYYNWASNYKTVTISFAFMLKPTFPNTATNYHYQDFLTVYGGDPNNSATVAPCVILRSTRGRPVLKYSSTSGDILINSPNVIFNFYEWHYVELKIYLGNPGITTLHIDGEAQGTYAAGSLLPPGISAMPGRFHSVRFHGAGNSNIEHCYSDIVIQGSTDMWDGTVLNCSNIESIYPMSNTGVINFDCYGCTYNYQCVDKVHWQDDTQHIAGVVTSSWKKDAYNFTNVTHDASTPIHAVVVNIMGIKLDSSGTTNNVYITGLVNVTTHPVRQAMVHDSIETVQTHNFIFELNPQTAIDWTISTINSAAFGVATQGD